MAAGYVTNYGNVENDGLSWDTPKRSIQSAIDAGLSPISGVGFFSEALSSGPVSTTIDSVGFLVFDGGNNLSSFIDGSFQGFRGFSNIKIRNYLKLRQSIGFEVNWIWNNCIISNIENLSIYRPQYEPRNKLTNCLFFNNSISHFDILENCTVYGGEVNLRQFGDYRFKNSIISESNVIINPLYTGDMKIVYTIFHNCTFKFTGGDQGADETTFTAPAGADDTEKLEDLRARMAVVYGGVASQYLQNCRYQTDGDLFIDPAKENFYLVPGCQAARMSYEAGYIGKYPEGSLADFAGDFVSYTNIDASGNIIDQTVDATAETDIVDLLKLRHINSLEALGQRATRNGNAVNVDADLGPAINPGTALTDGKTYIVRDEAISQTASGKTRDVGETFIATTADGLDFTSATGYVQEIYLDKPRSIELKVSKTDPTLANAVWLKMDLYAEPRINYDVNGVPQYGNLDPNYDEATSERLFIRYWKARVTIQAKNLPA